MKSHVDAAKVSAIFRGAEFGDSHATPPPCDLNAGLAEVRRGHAQALSRSLSQSGKSHDMFQVSDELVDFQGQGGTSGLSAVGK